MKTSAEGPWRDGRSRGLLRDAVYIVTRNVEAAFIRAALERHDWSRTRAARELGVSYRALMYKMAECGVREPAELETSDT